MAGGKVQFGVFDDLIAYARWGSGARTMVVFPGGPGNSIPRGLGFSLMASGFSAFTDAFTIYMVTRRRNLPEGYTTRDMSDDYARVIADHLGGQVDAVVGQSFGGMIAQHFAADHPNLCQRVVIAGAGHPLSDVGRDIDFRFGEHLSRGRYRRAAATIVEVLAPPGFARVLLRSLAWLLGPGMYKDEHSSFGSDVMVEVQAELSHDPTGALERIGIPVLFVGGTKDVYFPRESLEATAARIPTAVLKLYEGKGHMGSLGGRRFAADLREFLG